MTLLNYYRTAVCLRHGQSGSLLQVNDHCRHLVLHRRNLSSVGQKYNCPPFHRPCLLGNWYVPSQAPACQYCCQHCYLVLQLDKVDSLPYQANSSMLCHSAGIGFGDHCAFIYTAEMAPPRWRGRLNTLVQLGTIGGIVVANAINIGTNNLIWGWRLSLGLAAVPGLILLMGELSSCRLHASACHFGCSFCMRAAHYVPGVQLPSLKCCTLQVYSSSLPAACFSEICSSTCGLCTNTHSSSQACVACP